MSCLLWLIGGFVLIAGGVICALSISEKRERAVSNYEWLFSVGLIVGGPCVMFFGSVAMQVGAWIAGKNVWFHSQSPLLLACKRSAIELASVCGLLGVVSGLVWFGTLFIYRDFSAVGLSLGLAVIGAGLLAITIILSRR